MPTGSIAFTVDAALAHLEHFLPGAVAAHFRRGREHAQVFDRQGERLAPSSKAMSSMPGLLVQRDVGGTGRFAIHGAHYKIARMIGILIVSHGAFGESLIHSASHVLGHRPLYLRQLGVTVHDDPEAILPVAEDLIRYLDQGQGVLVLTDIFGATPSNIAARLLKPGRVEGVAGVNLPMLIRALTYREERASRALVEKALSGATEGVMRMDDAVMQAHRSRSSTSSACTRAPRPSSRRRASRFQSAVWISRNGRRVNAKSIMGVMMLAAGHGHHRRAGDRRARRGGRHAADRGALQRQVRRGGVMSPDVARDPFGVSLHDARHRRVRRHRHRPRAPLRRHVGRGRPLRDHRPPTSSASSAATTRAVKEVRDELTELADERAPQRRGRARALRERAPHAPRRRGLHGGAARASSASSTATPSGRCAAAGRAAGAVQRHRGHVPARARGRRAPGGRARAGRARRHAAAHRDRSPSREDASILVARDLSPADVILFREHPFAGVRDRPGRRHVAHRDRRALA